MNSATEAYIREHREEGAQAISEALQADQRFSKRITADELSGFFGRQQEAAFKLRLAVANESVDLPIRAGIDQLLEVSRKVGVRPDGNPNGFVATDDPEMAAQIRQFAPAIVSMKILDQDEADALLALAGGPHFDPLTPDEIKPLIEQLNADAEFTAMQLKIMEAASVCRVLISGARGTGKVPSVDELTTTFSGALK